ncbi:MAG: hypothetical protein ACO1RX_12790 [Candidatus Sericytochromatia bacterium]
MTQALSLVVACSPYLSPPHLEWQIDAFNRQTSRDFQVFYLHQGRQLPVLQRLLKGAFFAHRVIDLPFPWLADTCCWELVTVLARLFELDVHGPWMSYLHSECLPAPDFVAEVLTGAEAAREAYGDDCVLRLNQLRCTQSVEELDPLYPLQLAASDPIRWTPRTPYQPTYVHALSTWEEDAFALSVNWIRRKRLFAAVREPLFFQDLFDILYRLPELPAFAQTQWVHLGKPVIWHLNHPRAFYEYRQPFLTAVRQHPELFGHLALYELAAEPFDYREGFAQGERVIPSALHRFVRYMRFADNGTVTRWLAALQALGPSA